jgi:hypothetical protein
MILVLDKLISRLEEVQIIANQQVNKGFYELGHWQFFLCINSNIFKIANLVKAIRVMKPNVGGW